jgi:hypothetical protein
VIQEERVKTRVKGEQTKSLALPFDDFDGIKLLIVQ